jgi:hypothetical protein
MNTATARIFITAAQVIPGDRLIKHGVTVTSVERDERGNVVFGYSHTTGKGAWFANRKFHVARRNG